MSPGYHLFLGNFLFLIWKLQNTLKTWMLPVIKISRHISFNLLVSFIDFLSNSGASAWVTYQTYLIVQQNQAMVSMGSGNLLLNFIVPTCYFGPAFIIKTLTTPSPVYPLLTGWVWGWAKWFLWTMAAAQAAENHEDEWGLTWYFLWGIYTAYSEHWQISKMEWFAKIVNGLKCWRQLATASLIFPLSFKCD